MVYLKEITIRYKTYNECLDDEKLPKCDNSSIQVLLDGKPIERLKYFSIEIDTEKIKPVYTIKQYMDYPTEKEYTGV